ncbi:Transcription initiation factor TFIID subunit 2-like protein [Drosera capensis]
MAKARKPAKSEGPKPEMPVAVVLHQKICLSIDLANRRIYGVYAIMVFVVLEWRFAGVELVMGGRDVQSLTTMVDNRETVAEYPHHCTHSPILKKMSRRSDEVQKFEWNEQGSDKCNVYSELEIIVADSGIVGLHAENLEIERVSVDGNPTEFDFFPHYQPVEIENRWCSVSSVSSAADAAAKAVELPEAGLDSQGEEQLNGEFQKNFVAVSNGSLLYQQVFIPPGMVVSAKAIGASMSIFSSGILFDEKIIDQANRAVCKADDSGVMTLISSASSKDLYGHSMVRVLWKIALVEIIGQQFLLILIETLFPSIGNVHSCFEQVGLHSMFARFYGLKNDVISVFPNGVDQTAKQKLNYDPCGPLRLERLV